MRRDNAPNYLDESIAAAQRLKGRWSGHMTLALLGNRDAHRLLPSTDVEQNLSLLMAFEAFRLDPKNDGHWRLLLALFAEAFFVPSRPRGGIKYWDRGRLCQLLADFAALKKENPNVRTDGEICELVKEKFGTRYTGQTATTLRRVLQDARNPAKNLSLKMALWKLEAQPETRGMTDKQVQAYAIELIAKRWTSD